MDITNTTGQDTHYHVTGGGGAPMGPHPHKDFPMQEAMSWPVLQAGSKVSCSIKSEGPWTVYFYVQGKGLTVTTQSASNRLTLLQNGGGFQVQID
jgi:hypothetical protein